MSRHQTVEHLAKKSATDVLSRRRSRESADCVNCRGQWAVTEQRRRKRWGSKQTQFTSVTVGTRDVDPYQFPEDPAPAKILATVVEFLWRQADDFPDDFELTKFIKFSLPRLLWGFGLMPVCGSMPLVGITITIWNLYSAAYKTEQRRWTE